MQFIIHSKHLIGQALSYEEELGIRCYIPGRDTPQTHGDDSLPINLEALMKCDDRVPVFWDGGSMGTLFDMGMAYALGKTLLPQSLISGRNWVEYFGNKLGKEIKYKAVR